MGVARKRHCRRRPGQLTGIQQCFYRTEPIASLDDPLFLPNLYNCARTPEGRQPFLESWLCLANMRADLGPLTWEQRARRIHDHVWGDSFNRSSEVHEGNSHWQATKADPRVSTVERWAEESRQDPYFVLSVPWRRYGKSVGETAEDMLSMLAPRQKMPDASALLNLMMGHPSRRRRPLIGLLQSMARAE